MREHREAVERFVAAVEGLDPAAWSQPAGAGKWSPAQTAEHLALAYEALLGELAGGPGLRLRATGLRQRLLRWLLLPHVLFHRSIPVRASAPRELRPPDAPADRAATLARLRGLAARTEGALDAARGTGGRVTHPYFGPLPPVPALRFCAVHVEHHRRGLSA